MLQETLKVAACTGCVALSKKVEALSWLVYAVIIVVLVSHLFKWRECRKNRARLNSIRERLRSREI